MAQAERTLAGKQQWEELDYSPISFIQDTNDYDDSSAEQLKELFADFPILKLAEAVISVFEGKEAKDFGFSYAGYYNQEIEAKWRRMPLVKLGKKLMEEKGWKISTGLYWIWNTGKSCLKKCDRQKPDGQEAVRDERAEGSPGFWTDFPGCICGCAFP